MFKDYTGHQIQNSSEICSLRLFFYIIVTLYYIPVLIIKDQISSKGRLYLQIIMLFVLCLVSLAGLGRCEEKGLAVSVEAVIRARAASVPFTYSDQGLTNTEKIFVVFADFTMLCSRILKTIHYHIYGYLHILFDKTRVLWCTKYHTI